MTGEHSSTLLTPVRPRGTESGCRWWGGMTVVDASRYGWLLSGILWSSTNNEAKQLTATTASMVESQQKRLEARRTRRGREEGRDELEA